MPTTVYQFNADEYHGACVVEVLISARELSPAARDMAVDEVLAQGASANGFDFEDETTYDSGDWPKQSVVVGDYLDDDEQPRCCGYCLGALDEDPEPVD